MGETGTVEVSPPSTPRRVSRPVISAVLVALAGVLAVVATFATWVHADMLDTDQWVQTSAGLLAEPEIEDALAGYLGTQLFTHVDTAGVLGSLLPAPFDRLSGPLGGAVEGAASQSIHRWVGSERFARQWRQANRVAHATMVAILRDDTRPGTSAADGALTLQLGASLRSVGERVGFPGRAIDRLPPDAGTIVIFESDELASAQRVVAVLDALSWWPFVVVIGLYVAAVVIAHGQRLVALHRVGLSIVAAGIAVIIVRTLAVRAVIGAVVDDPGRTPVASIVAGALTEPIGRYAWGAILYGILVAAMAAVLGGSRWAVATRRHVAGASAPTAIVIGVLAVGVLLVWSPGGVFDGWLSTVVFAIVGTVWVVAFVLLSRRETRLPPAG